MAWDVSATCQTCFWELRVINLRTDRNPEHDGPGSGTYSLHDALRRHEVEKHGGLT